MRRNYGRLAITIAAGLSIVAFVWVKGQTEAGKIFLDGPLSMKHKELEDDCESCHLPWQGVSEAKCMACHEEKKHFQLVHPEVKGLRDSPCTTCHSDPKHLKVKDVDARATCVDCHREHKGETNSLKLVKTEECVNCHHFDVHVEDSGYGMKPISRKSGVLLTHNTFYQGGEYVEKKCMGCHLGPKAKPIRHSGAFLVDAMFRHMTRLGVKCFDCHDQVKTVMFDAKGGGVMPQKCIACHKKKRVHSVCATCHQYHLEPKIQAAEPQPIPETGSPS
ncbi:MAG: cytochrome c3 family protein [Nitrospinota bacterium]|nr:cytochrome c3 family protein [Nitrospinota bacterium]